jgi:putative heme-binding domain-containing protein
LGRWLEDEFQPDHVAAILASLHGPAADIRPFVEAVIRNRRHSTPNRLTALARFDSELGEAGKRLAALSEALEDGPVLADALRRAQHYPKFAAIPLLAKKLKSPDVEVRAAAIETLGTLHAAEGREPVVALLQDKDVRVRRAAAGAAGKLKAKPAIETLLKLMTDADPAVRRACLNSLGQLREPRAVPLAVAALRDRELEREALSCLASMGGPAQAEPVIELAKRNPSIDVLSLAVTILLGWQGREKPAGTAWQALHGALAEIQGSNGILLNWTVREPLPVPIAPWIIERVASVGPLADPTGWSGRLATGMESRVQLVAKDPPKNAGWLAYTDVVVPETIEVEFLASSRASLQVWLNGRSLHRHDQDRVFQIDSDRFAGTLVKGANRLLVQVGSANDTAVFHLRFRRKSAKAEHERLTQAALTRAGNPASGRKLFLDTEKSLCLKCHRLSNQGERIGPDLTGVGSRFSRIYLVESILEPSRTIAPSFGTLVVALKNGKVLTGVKVTETETTLTLADNQGQKHLLTKADIEEQQVSPVSTMPEGLEKRLTVNEFVDLIAFLASQQEGRGP